MNTFLTVVLILSCIVLIASILLQSGKSAGMSGAIGGGAEQLFGKQKARGYEAMFDKVTKAGAIVFILSTVLMLIFQ